MYAAFGGVPRKQHTIEENVFYLETLETLTKLICATVLDEIEDQTKAVNYPSLKIKYKQKKRNPREPCNARIRFVDFFS